MYGKFSAFNNRELVGNFHPLNVMAEADTFSQTLFKKLHTINSFQNNRHIRNPDDVRMLESELTT
jgi:hypothetical protein